MIPKYIQIILAEMPAPSLQLLSLQGEEALNAFFSYTIIIRSEKPLSANTLIFQPIQLAFEFQNHITEYLNAVITHITPLNAQDYQLTFMPDFIIMNEKMRSQTFLNQNVLDTVSMLCKKYPDLHYDFSQIASEKFEPSFQFQYEETDWNFLKRILQNAGLFFYFAHQQEKTALVLGKTHPCAFITAPSNILQTLRLHSNTQAIHAVLQGGGVEYLHVGQGFIWDKQSWIIQKVELRFSATPRNISCYVFAISLEELAVAKEKAVRMMPGPLLAKVITQSKEKIAVRFDVGNTGENVDSALLPILQNAAGKTQHHLFLPRPEDIVLVHFIDGDANQPLVLDSIPRASIFSLPEEKNILGLRSPAHEMSFDSTEQQEKILIQSSGDITLVARQNVTEKIIKNKIVTVQSGNQDFQIAESASILSEQKITLQTAEASIEIDAEKIVLSSKKIVQGM